MNHGTSHLSGRRVAPTAGARRCLAVATAVALAPAAAAHAVDTLSPSTWARTWSWEPGVVVSLFLAGALYASGLQALRAATGDPRKLRREAGLFAAGWLLVAIALVSPIDPLGGVLFSAHMAQHELLMVAAAPLLALSRPGRVWLWALPRGLARPVGAAARRVGASRTWRRLDTPVLAWLGHALALWLWHVPAWFDAALRHDAIHALQHAGFLGSAFWFWHAMFFGPRRRASYGPAVVYVFTTALHTAALGALLTFTRTAWYAPYEFTTAAWNLRPLEDQQLGGLIMWVPGGLTYVVAALALFAGWLRESDRLPLTPPQPPPTCVPSLEC